MGNSYTRTERPTLVRTSRDLVVPDRSTLSGTMQTSEVVWRSSGQEPVHLLMGSTSLRLCGPGECLFGKQVSKRRRARRTLNRDTDLMPAGPSRRAYPP